MFRPVSVYVDPSLPPDLGDTPNTWHSQHGQDYLIASLFKGRRGGSFVDLAANAPTFISNTRALERDYGWTGICVDANQDLLFALARHRKCQVVGAVVSSASGVAATFRERRGQSANPDGSVRNPHLDALSSIVANDPGAAGPAARRKSRDARDANATDRAVRTIAFADLLRAHAAPRRIEFLSLDVEQHEEQVMLAFPYHEYTFVAATIETASAPLARVLERNDYTRLAMAATFADSLWVHASFPGGVAAAARAANASHAAWRRATRGRSRFAPSPVPADALPPAGRRAQ